jgi:cobalt-zinc-cadmium efflux system membrane fusion protein
VGQTIRIHVEGEQEMIEAVVVRTSPALDVASRSLQIEAEIPNSDGRFRSGLFAEGYIEVDSEAKALAIPTTALGEFAGVHKVWVEKARTLEPRRVEVGRRDPERIEILSGLEVGERVLRWYADGETRRRATMTNKE